MNKKRGRGKRKSNDRQSVRLKGYDYSGHGTYYVTICSVNRECLFGDVVGNKMVENKFGGVVRKCWDEIPRHFRGVELDAFTVMPNHVHGIINIVGATHASPLPTERAILAGCVSPLPAERAILAGCASPLPTERAIPTGCSSPLHTQPRGPIPRSIGAIVGSFKSAVTKRINEMRQTPGAVVWQRNYYEHIVRDEKSLNRIREYIGNNMLQWESDRECPVFLTKVI